MRGRVIRGGESFEKVITFYQKKSGFRILIGRVLEDLKARVTFAEAPVGEGRLQAVSSRALFAEGMLLLDRESRYVIRPGLWFSGWNWIRRVKMAMKLLFG